MLIISVCVCVCVYVCVCICGYVSVFMYRCVHVCVSAFMCMCVHLFICMYICLSVFICMCVCVCVYVSAHACMYEGQRTTLGVIPRTVVPGDIAPVSSLAQKVFFTTELSNQPSSCCIKTLRNERLSKCVQIASISTRGTKH